MKTSQILSIISSFAALAATRPVKREVPQEHSHQRFLTSVQTSLLANNPDNIQDSVFGLLGDAAAAAGKGNIQDVACLHQATADQAFTNAKAAADITAMTNALVYAALERNTAKVGQASAPCTSITAANPEIDALSAHQDPASANAAAINKQITLTLAQQIASIGGDPQVALKSGTFAPGDVNDNTGKGNTCDDANDAVGCIETLGLLVEDATAEEIDAAVAGGATATATAADTGAGAGAASSGAASASSGAASSSTGDTASSSSSSSAPAADAASCDAAPPAAASTPSSSPASGSTAASDFGSCTNADPTIKFADNLDGRTEPAFAPNDSANFNHGSALNIKVIADFICQQLGDKCKAGEETVAKCQAGATKAEDGLTGQEAADKFNEAFL